MTTKVVIACPDHGHWHVKVEVRDQVYSHETKAMTNDWSLADSFVLKQGESKETYITSTRKLIIEETVPD
jgi:hypothetical protein